MEGTLSARPRDRFVPGCEEAYASEWSLGAATQFGERMIDRYCGGKSVALAASATALAAVAAGAQLIEPLATSLAPACGCLAAVMTGLMWRGSSEQLRGRALVACDEGAETEAGLSSCASPVFEGPLDLRTAATGAPSGEIASLSLAAELQRAAILADLTARMSHELRTPLNAVIGFSEVMTSEMFGPLGSDKYHSYAQHIRECGQTLLKSTEDTLAITSALAEPGSCGSAGLEPISLGSVVMEAWRSVSLQALQSGVMLDLDLPEAVEITGDRRVFRQIVINLLLEALARADSQSRIEVCANVYSGQLRLTVVVSANNGRCVEESLAICVARTLLALHGQSLVTRTTGDGLWEAEATLDHARQTDFFAQQAA